MRLPEALETELCANPESREGWSVLADWLAEHGDAMGARALVLEQLRGDRVDGRHLEEELDELRQRHAGSRLGSVLASLRRPTSEVGPEETLELTWYGLYVVAARLILPGEQSRSYSGELLDDYVRHWLDTLYSPDAMRFLRRLEVVVWDHSFAEAMCEAVATSLLRQPVRALHQLRIRCRDYLPTERGENQLAAPSISRPTRARLFAAAPHLAELHTAGCDCALTYDANDTHFRWHVIAGPRGQLMWVYMDGDLTGDSPLTTLRDELTATHIELSMRDMRFASDEAVRSWFELLTMFAPPQDVALEACPPELVHVLACGPELPAAVHVRSVLAPFICDACNSESVALCYPQHLDDECERCDQVMRFAGDSLHEYARLGFNPTR